MGWRHFGSSKHKSLKETYEQMERLEQKRKDEQEKKLLEQRISELKHPRWHGFQESAKKRYEERRARIKAEKAAKREYERLHPKPKGESIAYKLFTHTKYYKRKHHKVYRHAKRHRKHRHHRKPAYRMARYVRVY